MSLLTQCQHYRVSYSLKVIYRLVGKHQLPQIQNPYSKCGGVGGTSKSSAQLGLISAKFGGFFNQALLVDFYPPPLSPIFRVTVRRFVVCFSVQNFP